MTNKALMHIIKAATSAGLNPLGDQCEPLAFNINKCYICPLTVRETQLKRCGACFKISYCSQEHQKKHWRNHKEYCKIIQNVEKILPDRSFTSREDFNSYRDMKSYLCKQEYQSKTMEIIDAHKLFMIQYAGRCEVCFNKNSRIVCHLCLNANYCSKEHMDLDSMHHSTLCKDYSFMTDVALYEEVNPFPSYSLRKGTLTTHGNMKEFIESSIEVSDGFPGVTDLEIALISRRISHPLSLLWGLKCINYKIPDELIIHVLGSAAPETSELLQWEIIPHIYPNIRKLTFVFIGPEVEPLEDSIKCKTCKNIIKIELSNNFYHDYVKSIEFQKPDIVCAFHCGFMLHYSTWQPSLKFLVGSAPLIISSFCEAEAEVNIKFVLNYKPDVVVQSKRNPFSGLSAVGKSYGDELDFANKIITVFSNPSKN